MPRWLIAGCGYVGTALGHRLAARGVEVWGLRRDPSRLPQPIRPLPADLVTGEGLERLPRRIDGVVYAAAAGGRDDRRYQAIYVRGVARLLDALRASGAGPGRFVYVSSTAVYGEAGGAWVDEASPTVPTDFAGRRLLEGEARVAAAPWESVVVRFGGIYGPGRSRLLDAVRQARWPGSTDPDLPVNRIHLDDCAGVLEHLARLDRPEPVYLGVDREPTSTRDVVRWLAARLGVAEPEPPEVGRAGGRSGGKRCSSERLVRSGYRFRHPTFREGLGALLDRPPAGPDPVDGRP
jgi:nucleoside-diphosphate-sugar epimerase